MTEPHIEPATIEDLPRLTELLFDLFTQEKDFTADRDRQMRGLRLILENPGRGRIFVLRSHGYIIGMINLLFTISTAEGGFVMILEDLVIDHQHRGHHFGESLLLHAIAFARNKSFLRISLLADNREHFSVGFFQRNGFIASDMVTMRLLLKESEDKGTSPL